MSKGRVLKGQGSTFKNAENALRIRKHLFQSGLYPRIAHARYLFSRGRAIGFTQNVPVGIIHTKRHPVVRVYVRRDVLRGMHQPKQDCFNPPRLFFLLF